MSFSGGADTKNIDQIVGCGIWPVTVATATSETGRVQVADAYCREEAETCEARKRQEKVQVEEL